VSFTNKKDTGKRTMHRSLLASIFLLGAIVTAHADNDVYNDITGRGRGNDALQVDGTVCDQKLGPAKNGLPTSAAYKRCMRARGWAFAQTQVEPGSAVCRATVLSYQEMPYSLNHHDVATMTLRIKPPRGAAYVTTVTRAVSSDSPPRQGGTMSVRCDPANPTDIHPVD
jgi:hypothetical protein